MIRHSPKMKRRSIPEEWGCYPTERKIPASSARCREIHACREIQFCRQIRSCRGARRSSGSGVAPPAGGGGLGLRGVVLGPPPCGGRPLQTHHSFSRHSIESGRAAGPAPTGGGPLAWHLACTTVSERRGHRSPPGHVRHRQRTLPSALLHLCKVVSCSEGADEGSADGCMLMMRRPWRAAAPLPRRWGAAGPAAQLPVGNYAYRPATAAAWPA